MSRYASAALAAVALLIGYVALALQHDAIAATLLSLAHLALLPWAIMRAGRPALAAALSSARSPALEPVRETAPAPSPARRLPSRSRAR